MGNEHSIFIYFRAQNVALSPQLKEELSPVPSSTWSDGGYCHYQQYHPVKTSLQASQSFLNMSQSSTWTAMQSGSGIVYKSQVEQFVLLTLLSSCCRQQYTHLRLYVHRLRVGCGGTATYTGGRRKTFLSPISSAFLLISYNNS